MKIIKNTSGRSTKAMRSLICKTHAHLRTLEKRPAPNWGRLRVKVAGREENYTSGRAFYHGHGYDWDMFLTLPRPITLGTAWYSKDEKGKPNHYSARQFCRLVYHELMHTYGYRHKQYNGIRQTDLEKLIPEDYELPAQPAPAIKVKPPAWQRRYSQALAAEKRWLAKEKRATKALKKARQKIRYYERTYQLS